ncbi:MAG: glycosyltransferase [Anaerolineaceae bacterium]|nr:glycosyltransferase [Anaerolineaceae bacterium]
MAIRLAYVMSRFPHLPETFILREMMELRKQGWDIAVYPLILQKQTVKHRDAEAFLKDVKYIPYISPFVVWSNIKALLRNPGVFISTFFTAVFYNLSSPKFLIRALSLFPKSVAMAEEMEREGVGHIHAHFATHPALTAWIINKLTKIPYSITAHAHDIYVERPMLSIKVRDAAFVAVISKFNQNYICKSIGEWARKKLVLIRCGVKLEDYTPAQEKPPDPFTILSIGSLQPYKGQKVLIDACAILRERGLNFTCKIVGGGELMGDLRRQISALNLKGIVELLGAQPQEAVANLLPNVHCYVQPSVITRSGKMEGIPVSLMEALACRLPVVATDISGISELVKPRVTGQLVEPGNPFLLANAIETVYKYPESALQMAVAGRELVANEFTVEKNTKKLSLLFAKGKHIQNAPDLALKETVILSSPNLEE